MQALNQGEVDTVLIAGMGGMLVCRILEQSPEVMQEVSTLVIQAQSDLCEVRKMIHKIGFFIEKEKFCMDAGKPYLAMRAVRGEEKTPYEPAEYEYGRLLPEVSDTAYRKFLLDERDKKMKLQETLKNNRLGRTILLLMIVLLSEPPLGLTESCLLIGTSCCRSLERWI